MASPLSNIEEMREEIIRLTQTVETLKKDAPSTACRRTPSPIADPRCSPCDWVSNPDPPVLQPCDVSQQQPRSRATKRKEVEARRYSGKESVVDYLKQFELTAKRNDWNEPEKASALLCALDGSARSILSEIDDDDQDDYEQIKQILLNRFGPVSHTEVHEQALRDLRLLKGQPIRELSTEVTRLAKLAYPDFQQSARNRLATNALINAIGDKDVMFYIKDKGPASVDDVCSMYERYRVLTGTTAKRPAAIQGVKPEDDTTADSASSRSEELLSNLAKQSEAQQRQVNQLTDAVTLLLQKQATIDPPQKPEPKSQQPQTPCTQQQRTSLDYSRPPPGPCPRCREPGHWRRDCPRQHLGNATRPLPAPGTRSVPHSKNA